MKIELIVEVAAVTTDSDAVYQYRVVLLNPRALDGSEKRLNFCVSYLGMKVGDEDYEF